MDQKCQTASKNSKQTKTGGWLLVWDYSNE